MPDTGSGYTASGEAFPRVLEPLFGLWRESVGLYLRTGIAVLEATADGLARFESILDQGASFGPEVDLGRPLDPDSPASQALLEELQGNILKAHARDHAAHLLVCFGNPGDARSHDESARRIRRWIGTLAAEHVTSAAAQRRDAAKAETLTTLLLASRGYEYLGERRPLDGAFREGMRDRGPLLADPPPERWEPAYRQEDGAIHALVIVADREPAAIDRVKAAIERRLEEAGGFLLADQRGRQERHPATGRPIEHFGFADGVSQPQLVDDGAPRKPRYDQRAPLRLVLVRDRHGDRHDSYGSYLVYRKLEQDVDSFHRAVRRVAAEIGREPELVEAMAVGRFKNGTPLATRHEPSASYDPRNDEDFDYDHDPSGSRCPLHAHIRKTNPRGSLGFLINLLAREQERRIARRGITYTDGPAGKGLLFLCYQADIRDQFEFLQREWANNPDFGRPGTGLDPVIGQAGGARRAEHEPRWPTAWGSDRRRRVRFDEHVRLLGGEYFFAPSLSGLRALAGADL